MFGLDASKQARKDLLDFAIKKIEGSKEYWLKGFEETRFNSKRRELFKG